MGLEHNARDIHGIVHEVIIDETRYEYGLTSCRRDFVWLGSEPDAASHWMSTFCARRTREISTCFDCLVAPPWGVGTGQNQSREKT